MVFGALRSDDAAGEAADKAITKFENSGFTPVSFVGERNRVRFVLLFRPLPAMLPICHIKARHSIQT